MESGWDGAGRRGELIRIDHVCRAAGLRNPAGKIADEALDGSPLACAKLMKTGEKAGVFRIGWLIGALAGE